MKELIGFIPHTPHIPHSTLYSTFSIRVQTHRIRIPTDSGNETPIHSLAHTHTHINTTPLEKREGLHYIALTQTKDTLQIHDGKVEIGNIKYKRKKACLQPSSQKGRQHRQSGRVRELVEQHKIRQLIKFYWKRV